jgi:LmbE family N-acetylglucosaminyl deacetylase
MPKVAFAVAAHPDDIEFMMGGTFLLLGRAGYALHYMNIANGSCGTAMYGKEEIIAMRVHEATRAAAMANATFHPPLVDDLMIYYEPSLVARLGAIVREVDPEILLLPSPQDYMEDHTNAARLGVTAAFCRGMRNFATDPPVPPVESAMAVYHAMPYGLTDQLRNPIAPHFYIDIAGVLGEKRRMLACHKSQKEWLDTSQGLDSYLIAMEEMSAAVGRMSGRFEYAEGWRRHLHLGFGPEEFDPLKNALTEYCSE